jgi:hypothetical protein
MRSFVSTIALLVVTVLAPAAERSTIFQRELWVASSNEPALMIYEGERKRVDLFSEPDINSTRVGEQDLMPRHEYPLLRTIEVTVVPGTGEIQKSLALAGRNFGAVQYLSSQDYYVQSKGQRFTIEVKQGTAIEILSLDSRENIMTCYFRITDEVLEVSHRDDTMSCLPPPFAQKQEPTTQLWSKTPVGESEGWFMHERGAFF